jgi:hypothetical protein
MRARLFFVSVGLSVFLSGCGMDDLRRVADVSEGTLVAGLGMPMREVMERSSVKFGRRLALAGMSSGSYANGNAYFDFELAGSGLRFHGCSMYSIDHDAPDETVTGISVCITPGRSRWPAYTRELRETAAKLEKDGWAPFVVGSQPSIESFMARDGGSLGTSDSGAIAVFEWRKAGSSLRLTANRAWDSARFWSMVDVVKATFWDPHASTERWLEAFKAYPGAQYVCQQHVTGAGKKAMHILWTLYATADEPEKVRLFYADAGGKAPGPMGETLALASQEGRRHLSVFPVAASYPRCDVDPPAFARTVFIVSQGIGGE